MKIRENVSLHLFSTFKTGGKARYFTLVKNKEDIKKAFEFAELKKLPVLVLGDGSNVLISDRGYRGLVINLKIKEIKWNKKKSKTEVLAAAGENWDMLVQRSVKRNLFGLENMSGIPGLVGAAPIQNIGAYGSEIKDVLNWVEVYDSKKHIFRKIKNKDCHFKYRDSIFKHPAGKRYVITSICLNLKNKGRLNLKYKDLSEYFSSRKIKNPKLVQVRKAVLEIRRRKFPDLKKYGTAGSFFKNPIVSRRKFLELKKKYPDMPGFPMSDVGASIQSLNVKIPLAWIIDKVCGLRGLRSGKVGSFKNQAIILVNYGTATSREIKKFSDKIKKAVRQKTGINIEMEVREI